VRYGENDEIPAGHYLPFEAEPSVINDTMKQMEGGIRALGLDNCAVNADLMLMDGRVYILEMTGRMGANCMPELSSIYIGYDIYRMIIETALGERSFIREITEDKRPCRPCFAQMVVSEQAGTLKDITIDADCDADVLMFSKPGDSIRKFACTSDCVGQVITQAETLEYARQKADDALKHIHLEIE
jgi:biotin carboxylase